MDDQVLYRAIKRQTTQAEQDAVEAWRRLTPANELRYQELCAVLAATARPLTITTQPPPVLEVLEAAARRQRAGSRRTRTRRIVAATIGVAALLVAGVTLNRAGVIS